MALQWVQDNIQAFKGDHNNVTLFGESAGASSVHLHVLAKHAQKLFHKAIMQSGTANMEWVFQANPVYKTRRMAEVLGLKTNDTKEILKFLQSNKVTPLDITSRMLSVLTPDERRRSIPLVFKPVIEDSQSPDSFIDQPILARLQQPNSITIPSIMGYNSAEGLAMMVNAVRKIGEFENDFARLVPRNIPLEPHDSEIEEIAKALRKFYLNGQAIKPKQLDNLTNIMTDYYFAVDMQNAAKWQAQLQPQAPIYFYNFDYLGGRNMYKTMFQMHKFKGACHGDELFYLFQMDGDETEVSERDQKIVKQLSNMWANFAKFTNPTPRDQQHSIECDWLPIRYQPPGDTDKFILNYLSISNNGCEMKINPDIERMKFWQNIYKHYKAKDMSLLSKL